VVPFVHSKRLMKSVFAALILTTILTIAPSIGRAETSCETRDLISLIPSAPKSQGKTNWCFAFSATDLLEQKLGIKISAPDLAVRFFKKYPQLMDKPTVFSSSGLLDKSINEIASDDGVCSEDDLHVNEKTLNYLMSFTQGQADKEVVPEKSLATLSEIFPRVETRVLRTFLDRYRANPNDAKKIEDLVISLISMTCKNRIAIPNINAVTSACKKSGCPNMIGKIDEALNEDKLSSINVYAGDLHSVTVVGRFENSNTHECTYVLRDSKWRDRKSTDTVSVHGEYLHIIRKNLSPLVDSITTIAD
jgi:hypothetical protein